MSRLKELLEIARARSKELEKKSELQRQAQSISHQIDLNPDRRADNLRLLRAYINAHQDSFVEILKLGSQSNYSKIERGESPLGSESARHIESELGLPIGWLERNNSDAIFLSNDEFQLIQTVRHAPADATIALVDAIKKLRSNRQH